MRSIMKLNEVEYEVQPLEPISPSHIPDKPPNDKEEKPLLNR